jgi:hypothetical protein
MSYSYPSEGPIHTTLPGARRRPGEPSFRRRLREFAIMGLLGAAGLILWAGVVRLVAPGAYTRQIAVPFYYLALFDLLSLQVAALLVAVLWPLQRLGWGGYLALGFLAAVPVEIGAALLIVPPHPLVPSLVVGGIAALILGGGLALWQWRDDHL